MAQLSLEEIAVLRAQILGPRPRLWLPARFASGGEGASAKPRLESLVPPTFEDVSGLHSDSGDLWDNLQNGDPLLALAGLNVLTEISHYDKAVEQAAAERYVRPQYRSSVTTDPMKPQPDYEFVFNRVGALIAMKGAVAAFDPATSQLATDEYQIGDIVLRANAFVNSASFQQLNRPPSDIEIAAEVMPTWELTNPRDLAYALARIYRMLEYLRGTDPIVVKVTTDLGIVFDDLRFDGLRLPDFVAIVFGLHAYATNLDRGLLLKMPVAGAINRDRLLSETKLPREVMDQFLTNRSIKRSDLRDRIAPGGTMGRAEYIAAMAGPIFATDFRVFRERPLMVLANGDHIILDLQFLTELLFSGLYFNLFFSLPSSQREEFSSLWGRIFELSVNELLEYYYPPPAGFLQTDRTYHTMRARWTHCSISASP